MKFTLPRCEDMTRHRCGNECFDSACGKPDEVVQSGCKTRVAISEGHNQCGNANYTERRYPIVLVGRFVL